MKKISLIPSERAIYKNIRIYMATAVGLNIDNENIADRKKVIVSNESGTIIYNIKDVDGDKIINDMLEQGWLTLREKRLLGDSIRSEITKYIEGFSADENGAVIFNREELVPIGKTIAFTSEAGLMIKNLVFPAYKQRGNTVATRLGVLMGDEEEFCKYLGDLVNGLPKAQIVLGYELSGILRQALYLKGVSLSELSSCLSVSGRSGCGKSLVTNGLRNMLFSESGNYSSDMTEIKIGETLKNAGICPSVFDDMSVNSRLTMGARQELTQRIYRIASGRARLTARDNQEENVFSPYIESREEGFSVKKMITSVSRIDGYGYRVIELDVRRGSISEDGEQSNFDDCLTKSREHADSWNDGQNKFHGQAMQFIRCFLLNHEEKLLSEYKAVQDMIIEAMKKRKKQEEDGFKLLDNRVANRMAVIVLSLEIAAETYKLDVDIDKVVNILLSESAKVFKAINGTRPERFLYNLANFILKANNKRYRFIIDSKYQKQYDPAENLAVYRIENGDEILMVPAASSGIIFDTEWGEYRSHLDDDDRPYLPFYGFNKISDIHGANNAYDVISENSEEIKKVFRSWIENDIMCAQKDGKTYKYYAMLGGIAGNACYKFNIKNVLEAAEMNSALRPPETIYTPIGKCKEYNVETDSVKEVDTSHAGFGI